MVDLSISWKAWREQAGGFQIGHSSSLLSLPSTNQYPTNVASTNTTSAAATAPDALVVLVLFTPNCRLSGLTQKLLSLSSVLSATVARLLLVIVLEKNQVLRPKHIPANTTQLLKQAPGSWIL